MSYFLGIDIGTSSVKLVAMDEAGTVVKSADGIMSIHSRGPDGRKSGQKFGQRRWRTDSRSY